MAIYDAQSKKVVVRVVYDGPGKAGKTTNLEHLCTFFTRQRRSEMYSGAKAGERTLFLDWLQLDGGLVRGHDLRCHLLTVPGQAVLSRRRQLLLSLADATVFVLDSTEEGLQEAKPMWVSMLACTGGPSGGVPVVVQANKQDQQGALTPAQIRERWELDPSIPIVAAHASTGNGVRETVVLAIRATAVRLQEELLGNGIGELQGHYESGEELERRMLDAELENPMSAVDVVLAAHRLVECDTPSASAASEPVAEVIAQLSAVAEVASDAKAVAEVVAVAGATTEGSDVEVLVEGRAGTTPSLAPTPVSREPDVTSGARSDAVASVVDPPPAETVERRSRPAPAPQLPRLPTSEIPNGLVWPATEGRKTLRRIPVADAVLRSDLMTQRRFATSDAAPDSLVFEAGIWCLATSSRRRYPDADQARNHLVRLAHAKLDLGVFCVPRTVLAVQKDADGAFWLWTVSLWLATLRSQMTYAVEAGDERSLGLALEQYGNAALRGLRLCLEAGLVVDVSPDNFGNLCGEAFYLRDEVTKGSDMPGIGPALLRCFDEYEEHPAALRQYCQCLLVAMLGSFRPGDLELLDVARSIETAQVTTEAGERGREQLLSGLKAAPVAL